MNFRHRACEALRDGGVADLSGIFSMSSAPIVHLVPVLGRRHTGQAITVHLGSIGAGLQQLEPDSIELRSVVVKYTS